MNIIHAPFSAIRLFPTDGLPAWSLPISHDLSGEYSPAPLSVSSLLGFGMSLSMSSDGSVLAVMGVSEDSRTGTEYPHAVIYNRGVTSYQVSSAFKNTGASDLGYISRPAVRVSPEGDFITITNMRRYKYGGTTDYVWRQAYYSDIVMQFDGTWFSNFRNESFSSVSSIPSYAQMYPAGNGNIFSSRHTYSEDGTAALGIGIGHFVVRNPSLHPTLSGYLYVEEGSSTVLSADAYETVAVSVDCSTVFFLDMDGGSLFAMDVATRSIRHVFTPDVGFIVRGVYPSADGKQAIVCHADSTEFRVSLCSESKTVWTQNHNRPLKLGRDASDVVLYQVPACVSSDFTTMLLAYGSDFGVYRITQSGLQETRRIDEYALVAGVNDLTYSAYITALTMSDNGRFVGVGYGDAGRHSSYGWKSTGRVVILEFNPA